MPTYLDNGSALPTTDQPQKAVVVVHLPVMLQQHAGQVQVPHDFLLMSFFAIEICTAELSPKHRLLSGRALVEESSHNVIRNLSRCKPLMAETGNENDEMDACVPEQ